MSNDEKHIRIVHFQRDDIAARWRNQYFRMGVWLDVRGKSSAETYNQLLALGPSPDLDKIDEIIGNDSWTHFTCEQCSADVRTAIVMAYDYEFDRDIHYCEDCINKAFTVLCDYKGGL